MWYPGMAFCDFCKCDNCKTGTGLPGLLHAQTDRGGRWICDVCYLYDKCVRSKREQGELGGPCDELKCAHRPRIITEWIGLDESIQNSRNNSQVPSNDTSTTSDD